MSENSSSGIHKVEINTDSIATTMLMRQSPNKKDTSEKSPGKTTSVKNNAGKKSSDKKSAGKKSLGKRKGSKEDRFTQTNYLDMPHIFKRTNPLAPGGGIATQSSPLSHPPNLWPTFNGEETKEAGAGAEHHNEIPKIRQRNAYNLFQPQIQDREGTNFSTIKADQWRMLPSIDKQRLQSTVDRSRQRDTKKVNDYVNELRVKCVDQEEEIKHLKQKILRLKSEREKSKDTIDSLYAEICELRNDY